MVSRSRNYWRKKDKTTMPFHCLEEHRHSAVRAGWGVLAALLVVGLVRGETMIERPDSWTAKPQATCGLQSVGSAPAAPAIPVGASLAISPAPADHPLANYARTALRAWQMPGDVGRAAPWLRVVL